MSDELVEGGVTRFSPPPSPVYRYVISCKADQISISLEDKTTRQQWRTGYLTPDAYLTKTNRLGDAAVAEYVSVFKEALGYLVDTDGDASAASDLEQNTNMARRELTVVSGGLQLGLSLKVKVRQSTLAAKFVFKLAPVSLGRIDVLEAKLRDIEDELVATKTRVEELVKTDVVFLEVYSDEQIKAGTVLWNSDEADGFALADDRTAIRFLVGGCYTVNLNVDLAPKVGGASIEIRRNGDCIEPYVVPFIDGIPASRLDLAHASPKTTNFLSLPQMNPPPQRCNIQGNMTIAKIGNWRFDSEDCQEWI